MASKIGLFFGSDDGNTESVSHRIADRLEEGVLDILDISDANQMSFADYDAIMLGIPTWDFGQIQSDWEEFWDDMLEVDFTGKKVALFGLGDQFGYGDFFLDAMGMLHDVIKENGATIIGHWSVEGYEFDASKALTEDKRHFVGLALDEDQQPEQTSARLNTWLAQIATEFNFQVNALDD